MKKNLQFLILVLFVSKLTYAQDTLFYENFESGSPSFTLNTSDVNSSSTGYNHWVINNEYTGGSGTLVCIGFSFTFNVVNTDAQPGTITGSPNSFYMHTISDAAINNGINCCCFLAADGICNNEEYYFTKMTSDINTVGYDSVSLSFWWLCDGGNNSFGEVYYSIDGGSNWTLITVPFTNYNNHPNWSQQVLTLPAFAGQSTLRFGFRLVNQVALAATDPGFGIDEITITGKSTLGVNENNLSEDVLAMYPNPSNGIFNLFLKNNPGEKTELTISDITGRIIFKKTVDDISRNRNINIDLTKNSDTVYFLTLKSATSIKIKKLLLCK